MSLGKIIAHHRKLKGWSQTELGEKLGVTQSFVARWENDRARPKPFTLKRLSEMLEIEFSKLEKAESPWAPQASVGVSGIHDSELRELIQQIPRLNSTQQLALKTILEGLVARNHIDQLVKPV